MNNNQINTWCLYRHVSPSNKVYIGITHHENPELRWGKGGRGYFRNTVFHNAIKKYGWDNLKHEILFSGLSEEQAKSLEIEYIAKYQEQKMSYNTTLGGEGHNLGKGYNTKEYRTLERKKFREAHPNYDKEQYLKHKEKKLEAARNYYKNNREKILKYKKENAVQKEKARLRAAKWRASHPEYNREYSRQYYANKKLKNE